MRKFIILSLFLFIVFELVNLKAQTITKKLYPLDDTYTYSDNTIRGMEPFLRTYHSTAGSQFRRISYIKFDLLTLSPFIQSAKLRLYTSGFSAGGDNAHQFDLYPVKLNSWAEDDVTFINYIDKVGADITTPLLASYIVPAGAAFTAQYIEFNSAALTQILTDSLSAGKRYISFRLREKNAVKNANAAVVVDFHSKEHTSGFSPELVLEEKNIDQLKASDIKVNNVMITSFSESKYRNTFRLPWNETVIPTVTATAKYPGTTVSVVQATNITGTEAQRTAKVSLQNGTDILVYSVIFELLPPPTDARLSEITIDGKPYEFFNINTANYTVFVPYSSTQVPLVTPKTYDPFASFQITSATAIDAASSAVSRTTSIIVTSANGAETKTYSVLFERLPELDIVLAIGQSNMSGRAPYDDVAGPMNNVFLLTPLGEMEISANPMNKYSNIRKDLSVQGLGPSYTCATKLQNYLSRPIGFVVNAQGGSSITAWYQAGQPNYDASISRAKEAQRFGKIKAIIWHQGSADNSAGLLDNFVSYKTNLSKMVQNIRTDLNDPDLLFICGELSERPEFDQFTSIVIQPVSTYISNSDYVVTDGTNLLSDGLHFDEPSVKLLGERYAEKIIDKLYKNTEIESVKKKEMPLYTQEGNQLKIQNKGNAILLRISDLIGHIVFEQKINSYETIVFTLKKGMNIISYSNLNNGEKTTTKLFIL